MSKKGIVVAIQLVVLMTSIVLLTHYLFTTTPSQPTSGPCYTLEGWSIKDSITGGPRVFNVWVNTTSAPSGINFGSDVQNAMNQYNSVSRTLYQFSTYSGAQVVVDFSASSSSSELGESMMFSTGTTETGAYIHLTTTVSWSDTGNFLGTTYSAVHVLLHEFGHVSGLGHTNCTNDVMYPTVSYGQTQNTLGDGDKAGVKAIYA